jgi:hypothetical protein
LPAQQAWLLPPQVPQVPLAQTSVVALQSVPQQSWPVPPQPAHGPFGAQIAPAPQVVPQQG